MAGYRKDNRGGGGRFSGRSGGRSFRDRDSDSSDRSFRDRGSNRGFGGRDRDFRSSRRGPPEMHKVICDECGKKCEVPFKPTKGKPIYCNECFGKSDSSRGSASSEQLDKINVKLDKIMKALKIE
ncbi:MAG: CxxC-x17-CxxC domain-containing protein [archaeon]